MASHRGGPGSILVRSCGVCGGQGDTGAGFLRILGFSCQFSFHQMLHSLLTSLAGTIGQLVADVPSGLSPPQPEELICAIQYFYLELNSGYKIQLDIMSHRFSIMSRLYRFLLFRYVFNYRTENELTVIYKAYSSRVGHCPLYAVFLLHNT
jgi:hypothetical protein